MGVFLQSPAKINLGLRIVGRRPDGYHLLESLFVPIDLFDQIEIDESRTTEIMTEPRNGIAPSENIVAKIFQKVPPLPSMRIQIKKIIPMGGGLGGGSSNAGTVLRYFVSKNLLSQDRAIDLAVELGADVPFFLDPRPTWVTGVGEKRKPVQFDRSLQEKLSFVILPIQKSTSTQNVFARFAKTGLSSTPRTESIPNVWSEDFFVSYLATARNDLEEFAMSETPEIVAPLAKLKKTSCSYASVSGSGSTGVAVFLSPHDAASAQAELIAAGFDAMLHVPSIIS